MTTELMTDETSRSHVCARGVYCGTPEPCAKKKKKKKHERFQIGRRSDKDLISVFGKNLCSVVLILDRD